MRKMTQMQAFVNRSYKEERRKQKACGREGHAPPRPSGVQTPRKARKPPRGRTGAWRASEDGGRGAVTGQRHGARGARRPGGRMPPESKEGPLRAPEHSKRPARARRPGLPRAGPAVLSAMAGLTAGFGMGPGDPRLRGRARAGRSPRGPGSGRPGVLRPACARLDSS